MIKIYKPLLLVTTSLTLLLSFVYGHGKKQYLNNKQQPLTNKEFKITIDVFSTFPPEIDGCSCCFSNNAKEFKKKQYMYLNDFAQISFLKINGVLTKFMQTSYRKMNKTTTIAKAKSKNYELAIEIKTTMPSGEEASLCTGIIIITDKKGNKVVKEFYGECGC
ncbi:hypothetical protein [Parasediminibacterium sp. JCM 36343]|uniref:hypothetical protein n=1 Tax=Parasediminibacterium sp. JCM 36343 TaxID=3374279 RepID=UPI00397C4022